MHRARTVRTVRLLAVGAALAIVFAACGRPAGEVDTAGDAGESSSTSSTVAQAETTKSSSFGSVDDVCQPGEPTGAPAQGVTADSIRIATVADPGATARPGLDQEFFDTAAVFASWCNDRGGINGRSIVVDERDAALTNYKPVVLEACKDDFFMVGGGAVFDNTGTEDRLDCLLPNVAGYVVTPEAAGSDLQVQPLPNSNSVKPIGDFKWLAKKFPGSQEHVGILAAGIPATTSIAKQDAEMLGASGFTIVYDDQYPVTGPTSWAPYVQSLKDKGVEGLVWLGEPENLAKFEQALVDADVELDWVRTDPNHYDQSLLDVGGPAIKNTYINSAIVPFEEAGANPAVQQYLDAFDEYLPNGKARAYLGMQAWSAWVLFAKAAGACGNDLTRRCVYDNLLSVKEWDGGGLHAPTDPGGNRPTECFTVISAEKGKFTLVDVDPNDGVFQCSKKNLFTLTGDYGRGLTLADVGKRLKDLQ